MHNQFNDTILSKITNIQANFRQIYYPKMRSCGTKGKIRFDKPFGYKEVNMNKKTLAEILLKGIRIAERTK